MKFKYSVIGDNTQENREWLDKVGYEPFIWDAYDDAQPFITTIDSGEYTSATKDDRHHYMCSLDINCIGNPPLFKAVSAMREDSDYGQLFECKDGLFICQYKTSREHIDKECKGWDITNLHKCTLEQLQERFKVEH